MNCTELYNNDTRFPSKFEPIDEFEISKNLNLTEEECDNFLHILIGDKNIFSDLMTMEGFF